MRTPVDYSAVARSLIADYGLTHDDFARLAEVSEKTVGRWVGAGPANAKGVRRAMTKLRVNPDDYGVPPVLGEAPPFTQAAAPATDPVQALLERTFSRVADVPLIKAEVTRIYAELKAIREHMGIEAPTTVEVSS